MPSFDVVSQVNMAELDNAIAQTKKELETRYDLKGAKASVEKLPKNEVQLKANSQNNVDIIREMLFAKIAKRGISLRNVDVGKMEESGVQMHKQTITVREGIEVEKAKKLVAAVKDSKIKVQASIQADTLRVSGKNRDDLQATMALLRGLQDQVEVDLQFNNFRD